MNVASMMSHPVLTPTRDTAVADVVRTMAEHRVSALPVVDQQQKVVGVVTVAELMPQTRNAPASNIELMALCDDYVDAASISEAYGSFGHLSAADVMKHPVVTIRPEADIGAAAQLMVQHGISALPVVRADGVLVGIVTRTDVARLTLQQDGR